MQSALKLTQHNSVNYQNRLIEILEKSSVMEIG